MKEIISTEKAPAAIGPYSQAVKAGNLLFISGQIPVDPATGEVVEATIQAQTAQSLTNLKADVYKRQASISTSTSLGSRAT